MLDEKMHFVCYKRPWFEYELFNKQIEREGEEASCSNPQYYSLTFPYNLGLPRRNGAVSPESRSSPRGREQEVKSSVCYSCFLNEVAASK
jgi:hypothetical protein